MNQMEMIKKELTQHIGKRIVLKANKGRKKYVTRFGKIKAVYPSLFVVAVENGIEMTTSSYTYSDVLTSTVMISVIEDDIDLKECNEKIS